jgi:predicted nucleic acid-binding protein
MSGYFADTWYFVALIKRDDQHHEAAKRISASLAGATVVTSDAVLIELLNYVSETGELLRARAAEFVSRAISTVIPILRLSSKIDISSGWLSNSIESARTRGTAWWTACRCASWKSDR